MNATYKVLVTDFIAKGGDGFHMLEDLEVHSLGTFIHSNTRYLIYFANTLCFVTIYLLMRITFIMTPSNLHRHHYGGRVGTILRETQPDTHGRRVANFICK